MAALSLGRPFANANADQPPLLKMGWLSASPDRIRPGGIASHLRACLSRAKHARAPNTRVSEPR